jgi:NADP-dependent 3-hydroxy acid dehydrogenase YdfG
VEKRKMTNPVCLITGVGDGTGAALARRFAKGGYQVAMLARNRDRLERLEKDIADAKAYVCDMTDLEALLATVESVRAEIGVPSVLVHNAVSATFKTFLEADPEDLEWNFRVNTTSLLYLARALAPAMVAAGHGAIMVTGNTAALRGIPTYAVFAPTKAAQRILAQSLARDLGPKGIHVAYITIDAAIDTPWTRDVFNRDKPDDFFSKPADIADEVFHVVHQPRSTWSFDVEIRPYGEKW